MNHSFSQIVKHIISKWYIVLVGLAIIFACSYLLISKTAVGGTVNQYRAVVSPGQYVDQEYKTKADYDGYMTLIASNDIIQAVIDSDEYLKTNLTLQAVIKNMKINKYNTVNIEILFSHSDAEVAKIFMTNYFGSSDSIGMTQLNNIYHELYPDYTVDKGTTSIEVKRGDAKLVNSAILYEKLQSSQIVSIIICTIIGLLVLLVLMVLPFIFRNVDYIDENIVEDFDTVILGSIKRVKVQK